MTTKKEEKKPKAKSNKEKKGKNTGFSLRGVRDLRKQRELLENEIERLKAETEKLNERLLEINKLLRDEDLNRYPLEEVKEWIKEKENKSQQQEN